MAILCFPGANSLERYLLTDPLLSCRKYKRKGITQAVTELAVRRLANQDLIKRDIDDEAAQIVGDLLNGRDSVTGKKILKLSCPTYGFWKDLTKCIERALTDCAKS